MNVHDIIVENKVEENPLDYVKRAMGSKSAATKIDIDQDSKRLTKDFMAFVKNTPNGKPTTQLLFQFLQDVGLPVSSEKEIISAIRKNPSTMRKMSGLASKAGSGIKKAAQAVGKKLKGAEPVQKKDSDPKQMELPLESIIESIMEATLAPSDVQGIIKYFAQKGLQTTGAKVDKSKYAVSPGQMPKKATKKPASKATPSFKSTRNVKELEQMADKLRKAGYTVVPPK